GQLLVRIAFAQLRPLLETRILDVAPPGLSLGRVSLERQDSPAEIADARGEPDRGVAARAAELEHLAVGLRRDEREEEPSGRRHDLARTLLRRQASFALGGVLALQAFEHGAYAVVQHGPETIVDAVRAELTIEIARTPEEVFSYLTDVSNVPTWQAGVKSAALRDGQIEESRTLFG